jgi:hypothetical protein
MKKLLAIAVLLIAASSANAQTWVNPYFTNSGTFVQEHYRSTCDYTARNNWSTSGNINPYTGIIGTNSLGTTTSQPLYTGPRGGTYYYNSNGNKEYVRFR